MAENVSIQKVLSVLKGVQKHGDHYQACCPAHQDDKASLSVGVGSEGKILIKCHAGCDTERILSTLGMSWSSLFQDSSNGSKKERRQIAATYDYLDAKGTLLFQAVRFSPKSFSQRRPDGQGGWIWNLHGVDRILYRLPEVMKAETIFIPEGDKDCDALAALGLVATTNPQGAGKWNPELSIDIFKGKRAIVLPDNDTTGRKHGLDVATKLFWQGAASVKILDLPDLPDKGDVSDWLRNGGTKEKLLQLVKEVPEFKPSQSESKSADSPLTEDSIAAVFADRFKDDLRYCHHTGTWYRWQNEGWRKEDTRLPFHRARELCRELNINCNATLGKASTASAIEQFARADRAFAVTSEIWDKDPMLLGTPGGVIDLRTGKLRLAARDDYITKRTSVAPADLSQAPLWFRFLREATREDDDLQLFLRQICGYCLTGEISEHALFFIYGPGGNGKGVFLNTFVNILGDYARTASMDTFTASRSERHPTDLAMLRGARLVTASETEEGRAWAESRIKQLTGGDRISARFMRQDFFEFQPQFKLVIIGNHKPVLRNVDPAARRRFNIVPFLYAPEKPDKQLEKKLKTEYPAILRWMIEGCLDWQEYSLMRPSVVEDATRSYFDDQDLFGQWIKECCIRGSDEWEVTTRLYGSWKIFAERNGEDPKSAKAFSGNLSRREFQPDRKTVHGATHRVFKGIALKFKNEANRDD